MKRSRALALLLWPINAAAHGSASIFYLLWWHVALLLCILCFLIFGSVNWKRKLCSILGFVLVPVAAWSTLGSISGDLSAWQEVAIGVALGAAPVIGFVGGLQLTKSEGRAT
jgi:hypothetical protein